MTPNLPIEILRALAPALPLIREEVRQGVVSVVKPKINRAGKVAVRLNGDARYGHGFASIMATVFGTEIPSDTGNDPDAENQRETCSGCGCELDNHDACECECDCSECDCSYHCSSCDCRYSDDCNCDCSECECGND